MPGQAGGFNLQSVVSEYATEANMQNTADGVFGQQTVIGKPVLPFDVEVNVAAVAKRSRNFVRRFVRRVRSRSRNQMVIPLVSFHRKQNIETGVGQ